MTDTETVAKKTDAARALREAYAALKAEKPEMRVRDAARDLSVSEGELVAAAVGDSVVRLAGEAEAVLGALEPLGEVMALTRNENCVHERKGVYMGGQFSRHGAMAMGLFVNPDIDLRLFMNHWAHCFAVTEETRIGPRKSLQFFDKAGGAIHKIYLTDKSETAAYDALVAERRDADQTPGMAVVAYDPPQGDRPDSDIDWDGLRSAWENLQDTHDFFPMLRKYKVGREQCFRKVGADLAYRVGNDAARRVLDMARDEDCEIMVFVGNRGCIQIHTGPVRKLVEHGPWYNVLDPKFNLHLREDRIARTWVTRKPTSDGVVTALEVFDDEGELIATFFGKRKPGIPELDLWRKIVSAVPAMEAAHAA
ncbi:MAG TPA: hemin-degrading factor [Rhodospirillaceae bacterium]|nr:hemin-degrading factor [Rhodospirillaceae bacterium]|tara:strand:- start:13535 stop:14632 length:1098 start_codon:yes stop_codon:yes gene_type:complete